MRGLAVAGRPGRSATFIGQLLLICLFAVGAPYLLRLLTLENPADVSVLNLTALGVASAIAAAMLIQKNMFSFPGADAGGSVIPATLVSFGGLFLVFLLARFDYSRANLVAGLTISPFMMYWLTLRRSQREKIVMGVLPLGRAAEVLRHSAIEWSRLDTVDAVDSVPFRVLVTDLRVDLPDIWDRKLAELALNGRQIIHYKTLLESITGEVELEHLYESTSGSLSPDPLYIGVKFGIDWCIAAISLVVLFIPMCVIAVLILADSGGPVFFKQVRVGYRGHHFHVVKFRTMTHRDLDTPLINDAMTQDEDSRITKVGRFLRRTRIDEWPQMFNVLRGQMSLIGPRPEALPLSKWYEGEIAFYRYRHIVRPGITGWAQVNQGHVTSIDDVRRKLNLDFYYIKHISPALDILIVMKTLRVVLSGMGAK